ncbi:hypothetical protein [Paludisphaera soli]|uniref:hypothetical protein n=1 Tax=Paludisphaera soli TaxID=2712865 RepID=UPI0013EDFD67|nr:hypothetical protein [Paludisphaera soli]
MKPSRCPTCGGGRLQHGTLHGGLQYRWWRWATISATACLDCGAVATYLDDYTLDRLRANCGLADDAKSKPDADF